MRVGIRWSLRTERMNGAGGCSRFASMDLLLIVDLLDFPFFLATMVLPPINLVINLRIHHNCILLLGHLTSSFTWVDTCHCTPYGLVIIVEFIFKSCFGLHGEL
jgi:hypothetical protein